VHLPKRLRQRTVPDTRDGAQIGPAQLQELSTVFAAPRWLRDIGRTSWLLVGFFGVVLGLVWFLGATYTIGGPFIAGLIVATVTTPIVTRLARHMPRAAAAVIVLLGLIAIGVVILVIVIAGIAGQRNEIASTATDAASKAGGWLESLGVDKSGSASAQANVEQSVPKIISALTKGVINGISGLTSLVFGLSLAMLSLFFLLKDGPLLRAAVDRHLGVPEPVAQTITGGVIRSLRGYFRGVTLIAAFNGTVVGLGALLLGVPLAGTIAVVTFVMAYVPFVGAFVAGAFAVIIALGSQGTGTAIAMLFIAILANGLLQNIVQPFAMGAALDLHPLVTLVVTIAAGCIFGMLGLVLAAPLVSAAVHITADLSRARVQARLDAEGTPPATPQPTPAV
jgi:predicted PurR-regulated permease PerM